MRQPASRFPARPTGDLPVPARPPGLAHPAQASHSIITLRLGLGAGCLCQVRLRPASMSGVPGVLSTPGGVSSGRDNGRDLVLATASGSRGWNSAGRPRVQRPVGALVSPGPDHCLHGIPSGWSHDAPFAVRRPAHRLGTPSRAQAPGALSCGGIEAPDSACTADAIALKVAKARKQFVRQQASVTGPGVKSRIAQEV
jgi:hypothetical protein